MTAAHALDAELNSDPYLISLVRSGDTDAYGQLYQRHVGAARRLARVLARNQTDADDLVAETFTKMLAALQSGRGPDSAFRAYLLATLRNTLYDRSKRDRRMEFTDNMGRFERAEPVAGPAPDPVIRRLESSYAARAFARLPERWRAVLWHTEVEGESPAQIAPMLGLTPNGVAALAYRARERLRQMYLQEHIASTGSPRCHWTGEHLGGYVRAALARRDRSKVEDHLAECAECRRLHRELTEENSGLRGVLAPILLGGAAPGYLTAAPTGGTGLLTGFAALLAAWWQRLWHSLTDWGHELGVALAACWWWLRTTPRRLVERYGPGNVAAGTGLVAAGMIGVLVFAAIMIQSDRTEPPAALPVPAPAPPGIAVQPTPPAWPLQPPATSTPGQPSAAPQPGSPAQPGTDQAGPQPPSPDGDDPQPPGPLGTGPMVFPPEPGAAQLTAGETGVLRIPVGNMPGPARDRRESAPALTLEVRLPAGITLAGGATGGAAGIDAGDGWLCRASAATGTQLVTCDRETGIGTGDTAAGTEARIPVEVAPTVSGYQPIAVSLRGTTTDSKISFRTPVAPASMRVGFAATGPTGFALAGNTLLSCQPRPSCLAGADNNTLEMLPYLPAGTEPAVPDGLGRLTELPAPHAASGASLKLPAGAQVTWAGLIVGGSAKQMPELIALGGPDGNWHPTSLRTAQADLGRPVTQGFAEVTALVRDAVTARGRTGSATTWWLAAPAGELPTGLGEYAGWGLAVSYTIAGAPHRELAVYAGPRSMRAQQELSAQLGTGGQTEVGLLLWDGDLTLAGDTLLVGEAALGDPGNLATGAADSAAALMCHPNPGECAWRTPGLDVQHHRTVAPDRSAVTLRSGDDPLEVGLMITLSEIAR